MALLRINFRFLMLSLSLFICFTLASLLLNLHFALERSDRYERSIHVLEKPSLNADSISAAEFAERYISLSDQDDDMQSGGQGMVGSILHYLRPERPVKARRNNIFVAVVTTGRYLKTRARAIFETWAKDVKLSNNLSFFVGEDCDTSDPALVDMSIIKMAGIRDSIYPPQRKVFEVIRYIHTHFGDQFKWFIRADDDIYIRMRSMDEILHSLDWTKMLFLGHPGWGKKEDRQRLKLLSHENYCMGGPGVVFSAATLRSLVPYLDKCRLGLELYNQQHTPEERWYNEDVELGRCVSRTLGVSCTHPPFSNNGNVNANSYFFHIYNSSTLDFSTLWSKPAFVNAVTVHPVKNQDHLFRLHHFYKLLDYQALSSQLDAAALQLRHLCARLPAHFKPDKVEAGALLRDCFRYYNG